MHTYLARGRHVVRRLDVLALAALVLASVALSPATAWGQLYGRPVAQPCFDFPNWARWSGCRPGPLPWGYEVFPDYGPVDGVCLPDSVACEVDFVAHRPSTWYASADFVPMTMDYGSDTPIARILFPEVPAVPGQDNSVPPDGDFDDDIDVQPIAALPAELGPPVLTSDDLRPEFNAGGKFTLGRRIFDCYRIEGTYLGNYHWESSAIARSDFDDLSSILSGFAFPDPDPVFDENSQIFVAQATDMYSVEANVRYWVSMPPGPFDVSILVGARYMKLDDRFRVHSTNAGGENDLLVATENDLWGLQIGIQGACLKTTRFWIDFDLKGGIYNNDTAIDYELDSFNAAEDVSFVGAKDRTTFMGDISIIGHWQMTPWLVFNLGYQAIFLDGVTLGLSNVANPPFLDGIDNPLTTQFDDSGRIVFHGPTIGLMGIW